MKIGFGKKHFGDLGVKIKKPRMVLLSFQMINSKDLERAQK